MTTRSFTRPSHLSGEIADMWDKIKGMAGANPEAPVIVTDPNDFESIKALAAVGGCSFEQVEGGLKVTLIPEPDASAEEVQEVAAVAKPHKFAKEGEQE